MSFGINTVVFRKPGGKTEVTAASGLRRHKIQRKSMTLQAPIVCCEHIARCPYSPFFALQFSYHSLSHHIHTVVLDLQ